MSSPLAATEYPAYVKRYIDLVPEEDIVAGLEKQGRETAALLRSITLAGSSNWLTPDLFPHGRMSRAERRGVACLNACRSRFFLSAERAIRARA